jgi:hypothetical protein
MQKEFFKLKKEKQRNFIIKNLLKDDYFKEYHNIFSSTFVENIYLKNQQKEKIKIRNEFINNKITNLLRKYKDNVIDLHIHSTNKYFYDKILKQKLKLSNMINENVLNYRDEFGFTIKELIKDTYESTKNIVKNQELSLEPIVNIIPPFITK